MIDITINGHDYHVHNNWDIPLSKAIKLHEIVMGFPKSLLDYYQALIPVTDETEDERQTRISEFQNAITTEEVFKTNPKHYGMAIAALSDIPDKVISKILPTDRTVFFNQFIFNLAVGMYTGIADYEPKGIKNFEFNSIEYLLPETRMIMGNEVPMVDEIALVFTEAADLLIQASEMKSGKWDRAANIVSILCRPKDEEYDENKSLARAEAFKELPMWIVLEVFFCCIGPLIMSQQSDQIYSLRAEVQRQRMIKK